VWCNSKAVCGAGLKERIVCGARVRLCVALGRRRGLCVVQQQGLVWRWPKGEDCVWCNSKAVCCSGPVRHAAARPRLAQSGGEKGPLPTRPAVVACVCRFGDFIIVERRITERAGSYVLRNAAGKTVCTSKDVQKDMQDHFAIDAANPLTIVTQDMARCFLSGAPPREPCT